MRPLIIVAALFALPWLLLAGQCLAQCSGPYCPLPSQGPSYSWRKNASRPNESYLFLGGRQIGAFNHASGVYLPIVGEHWGQANHPPIAPPYHELVYEDRNTGVGAQEPGEPFPPTGVDPLKLGPERYLVNGKAVTRAEAVRTLVYGQQLEDDSHKPHITIVAKTEGMRTLVESHLADPKVKPKLSEARVQLYSTDREADRIILEPFRLETDASFQRSGISVFVQQPAGDSGASPPIALYDYQGPDTLLEALRKADPKYDPNKKPAPPAPEPKKPDQVPVDHKPLVCLAVGAAALAIWKGRKK